ncbi:uncharacterized isoform X2 [Fopius arisanus]|nr:PREDICTED: uncharacterized protein LOC105262792 isoform X2 [Fopius arisanus]
MILDRIDPGDVFFQNVLHWGMCDDTIQDVELVEKKAAVKKGENYLSYLTRFTLKYICSDGHNGKVEKRAHLIMKEEPNANVKTLEYIRDLDVFQTERYMLEEIVPKVEKLVGKRLGPKVYYSSNEPCTIVMEDLISLGFQNRNRKNGLNKVEVSIILKYIANFHAGSILLNEQNPGCVSRLTTGFISSKTPEAFFSFISKGLKSIAEQICNWMDPKFIPISDKLHKKSREICQNLQRTYQYDEDEFQVLNHGDLWVNNLMFKDDKNGEPLEMRMVDYQMCVWTSPAVDLLYIFNIVPETNIKMIHDDIFLQHYLTHLSNTMARIGCTANPPTLEQLKKSMYKRRDYGIMAGLTFWPKMIAEDDEIEDLDVVLERGEASVDLLKNPKARETLAKILPMLDERNYLD